MVPKNLLLSQQVNSFRQAINSNLNRESSEYNDYSYTINVRSSDSFYDVSSVEEQKKSNQRLEIANANYVDKENKEDPQRLYYRNINKIKQIEEKERDQFNKAI